MLKNGFQNNDCSQFQLFDFNFLLKKIIPANSIFWWYHNIFLSLKFRTRLIQINCWWLNSNWQKCFLIIISTHFNHAQLFTITHKTLSDTLKLIFSLVAVTHTTNQTDSRVNLWRKRISKILTRLRRKNDDCFYFVRWPVPCDCGEKTHGRWDIQTAATPGMHAHSTRD